ncbi:MAG: hypothetical protein CME63_06000 [Halobacteriovoraceae bacterium]|nr:hypothetical protein [Halobacteriovoraceae bacterium]
MNLENQSSHSQNSSATTSRQGENEKTDSNMELRIQVSEDLQNKLSEYNDPKKGIKALALLMGIHEKTLKRLISCENRPGYQTLFKIYRTIYHTNNDTQVINLAPPIVKEFLLKTHPKGLSETVQYTLDVERELRKDPVFCEIYLLCGTGGTTREYIAFNYGRYGERVFEKMIDQEVISPVDKFRYELGKNQAPLNVETLVAMGIQLTERYFKPSNTDELGDNYISFFAEGINAETYQKWLEIDKEAFQKKIALANNAENKGDIKSFCFSITETMIDPDSGTRH